MSQTLLTVVSIATFPTKELKFKIDLISGRAFEQPHALQLLLLEEDDYDLWAKDYKGQMPQSASQLLNKTTWVRG